MRPYCSQRECTHRCLSCKYAQRFDYHPAWNEEERIADCLMNATRQTVAPHEVIVVNNRSTDRTCDIVERFQRDHPEAPVILLQQNEDQGLIPTRNFGLNAATGDVLGRIDADCMLKPDWVEVVSGIFTEDPDAMGATGPVVYYDMPAKVPGSPATTTSAGTRTGRTTIRCCCSVRTWRFAPQHGTPSRARSAATRRT